MSRARRALCHDRHGQQTYPCIEIVGRRVAGKDRTTDQIQRYARTGLNYVDGYARFCVAGFTRMSKPGSPISRVFQALADSQISDRSRLSDASGRRLRRAARI